MKKYIDYEWIPYISWTRRCEEPQVTTDTAEVDLLALRYEDILAHKLQLQNFVIGSESHTFDDDSDTLPVIQFN